MNLIRKFENISVYYYNRYNMSNFHKLNKINRFLSTSSNIFLFYFLEKICWSLKDQEITMIYF